MSLETIAKHTRAPAAHDVGLPIVALNEDAHARGLVAWFGEDSSRRAASIVIQGRDVGVLDREGLYELVSHRTLGWGDSIGATLPGDPKWEPIELRCPIADCPRSPLWVLSFDPSYPPECTEHLGTALERVETT